MERILTPEERIRRAEEIYNRKKMQGTGSRVTSRAVNTGTKVDYSLVRKMLLQILICLVIYFIFYLISNTNYIFSNDVIGKAKQILSYDVNFGELYSGAIMYINKAKESFEGSKGNQPENTMNDTNIVNDINTNQVEQNPVTQENIGGAQIPEDDMVPESIENKETQPPLEEKNLSQMEIDANEIKAKYSLIKPAEGKKTSGFGLRNPTTPTVPKNHTGIDIGVSTGTPVIAALDGVVILASSEGDYRKPLKNTKR